MPNTKNVAQVAMLEEKFQRAKAVILANYTGLNSSTQTLLRQELKKAGGELIIAKNTLIGRILKKDELNQSLQNQTGAVFSYDDEVSALKVVVKFAENSKTLELKQGVIADRVYDAAALKELSKLPGKEQLVAMLLSRLNAPGSKLVGVLQAGVRDLAFVLAEIAKKKQA